MEEIPPTLPPEMPVKSKSNLAAYVILAVVLSAAITGGIVYLLQSKQNSDTKADLQAQVDRLKAQIAALPTPTPTPTSVASPSPSVTATPTANVYSKSNANSAFSFEYPGNATLVSDSIFTLAGLTYSVETPAAGSNTTIENWIKDEHASDTSTDLTQYTKTTVAGKTAYTFTGELRTYLMSSGKVYVLVARNGVAPSTDTTDATYAHFLSTFTLK